MTTPEILWLRNRDDELMGVGVRHIRCIDPCYASFNRIYLNDSGLSGVFVDTKDSMGEIQRQLDGEESP